MKEITTYYGIRVRNANDSECWLTEFRPGNVAGLLAFTSESEAQQRAAEAYGYTTYEEAHRDGWVDVRQLTEVRS